MGEQASFVDEKIAQILNSVNNKNTNGYTYTDPNGVVIAETQWYWGRSFIDLVKSGNFAAVFEY